MKNRQEREPCRFSIGLAISGVCLSLFASRSNAEPVRFSNGPGANWELVERDGDHHCLLRTKIIGSFPLAIVDADRPLGGRKLELTLHGPKTGMPPSVVGAGYVIGSGSLKSQQVAEHDTDDARRKLTLEFKDAEAAAISNGSGVSFAIERGQVITIDSSGLVPLLAALDSCNRNYLVELGAEPRMVEQVAVSPWAEDSDLFTSDDYPVAAIRRQEQGTAIALAIVDKTGRVSNCRIVRSSKSKALDQATCNTLKHRKFQAARDADGRPVDAPTTLRINWLLP